MNLIPKTDKEIRDMAMPDWVGTITRLWEAVGKTVDNKQLAVYVKELSGIPLELIEIIVSKMVRSNTWNSVPSIGAIWQEIHLVIDVFRGDDDQHNIDRWIAAREPKEYVKTGHAYGEVDYRESWANPQELQYLGK